MKILLYTLFGMCLILTSCSSYEPETLQDDKWVIEYYAASVNSENKQSFLQWCNTHEGLLKYSLPSRDFQSFSYENALMLKWEDYTTSEQIAQHKVHDFNIMAGVDEHSVMRASYRKYEPNFTGPWRIAFIELFSGMHNDSDNFNRWYDDHLSNLSHSEFLLNTPSFHWEYPSSQTAFTYYEKSYCGILQWYVVVPKSSESEIRQLIMQFESFSIIDNANNSYDTFVADYSPINP